MTRKSVCVFNYEVDLRTLFNMVLMDNIHIYTRMYKNKLNRSIFV